MSACPDPDETAAPAASGHPFHEPPLCLDVPIGRVVRDNEWIWPTYLSLDVELFTRDLKYYKGTVVAKPHGFRLRGLIQVLSIQVRVRPYKQDREPVCWITGFDRFGQKRGWSLRRFRSAPGVDVADLTRLAELSRRYNRNLKPELDDISARVVLIPIKVQREIREITDRLNRAAHRA